MCWDKFEKQASKRARSKSLLSTELPLMPITSDVR